MGYGEDDAEEPVGRGPLPPDDRIWRHPAEVAMAARRADIVRRRVRRLRAGATLAGGVLVVTGLVWISQRGAGDAGVRAEADPADGLASIDTEGGEASRDPGTESAATDATTADAGLDTEPPDATPADPASLDDAADDDLSPDATTPATPVPTSLPVDADPGPVATEPGSDDTDAADLDPAEPDAILVYAVEGDEPLAGALTVRDGYLATSGDALGDTTEVVVSWGDARATGTVVGHDVVTGVGVIRIDTSSPGVDLVDAAVSEGDEVNMATRHGGLSTQRVVAEASTSAKVNGDPMVGIVELDGRIGDVPPGSPAYAVNGQVVGITTATADDAPAAFIPIELAREVADEIIDLGWATHPWLGVTARDPNVADQIDDPGSLVTFVSPEGPAAVGGMVDGDLVTVIDHHVIESMAAMVATLRSYDPGDSIDVIVVRDGDRVSCRVELASRLDVEA
ncbi:MAG: S1C family serine protease [Acidimicrobiales bacterium]